jgi:poly-gamma-glutamate synthesis protein (capsule biosynthesis protein)
VFHFRSDARNIAVLAAAHIDAVSLANNHVLDFGYEALFDMLRLLEQAGMRFAGAGATFRDAFAPALWEVQGRRLGLLAFTDNEPVWAASEERPGIWYVPIQMQEKRAQHLFEVVRQTKSEVACLIVSAHWEPNWGYVPPPGHQEFARALIDSGADIIFGHSGHVVRGIEVYHNKPIIYCAGDFIDDYAVDLIERNDQSFLFMVELHETMPSRLLLYPTIISHFQAQRAQDEECRAIVAGMQQRCEQLHTEAKWNEREACLEIEIYPPLFHEEQELFLCLI